MSDQFFYTENIDIPVKNNEGKDEIIKKPFIHSFSMSKVIRTLQLEDGRRLVLLNDIHERMEETPIYNKKRELTGYKKEKVTVQSEIYLSPIDSERFYSLYKGTTEFTPTENSTIS